MSDNIEPGVEQFNREVWDRSPLLWLCWRGGLLIGKLVERSGRSIWTAGNAIVHRTAVHIDRVMRPRQ